MGLMLNVISIVAEEQAPATVKRSRWERAKDGLISSQVKIGEALIKHGKKLSNVKLTETAVDSDVQASSSMPVENKEFVISTTNDSTEPSKLPESHEKLTHEKPKAVASTTSIVKKDQSTTTEPNAPVASAVVADESNEIKSTSWNTTYVIGGVAAAVVTVSAIGYWYTTMSWHRAVNKLVAKAQFNPNSIIDDLSTLLESWDGSAQQAQIIEYIAARVDLTPELVALLDLYRQ